MRESDIKVYGYRWVVLAVYGLITLVNQIQWLTFAPISSAARTYYGVSQLRIDFLSMVYMIVFIALCVPASYVIDTYGLKVGLGIGAALTGVFGLMKGFFGADYLAVAIAQVGLAVAQPFLLNGLTKLGVMWFPLGERATAAGIGTLAQYLGFIVAMAVTPLLIVPAVAGAFDLKPMLLAYGVVSAVAAVVFLALVRDRPPTAPSAGADEGRLGVFRGLRSILRNRDMRLLLLIFFIGLGMFNAISTCIEQVCRGLTIDQAGLVGGLMLVGGVVGAVLLPALSDKLRRRKRVFVLAIAGMLPGVVGLTFLAGYGPLLAAGFVFGFFMLSAGPIGFQYGAELSRPAPESTSQGLLLLAGQISGILFVLAIDKIGIPTAMAAFVALTALVIVLGAAMRESPAFREPGLTGRRPPDPTA